MARKQDTVHYPKAAANAETTSRRQHVSIVEEGELLPPEKIDTLTRSFFDIAGAHPYVFDALSFICTFHRQAIERRDNSSETHFRVRIPLAHFLDFALDGRTQFKHRLMTELYDMASIQRGKVLPLDADHSVMTVPVRVELFYEDGRKLDPSTARQFENLKGQAPVSFIAIEFYKPLFQSLLHGKAGESWFPLPKAFHAKMLATMDKCRDLPEFKNAGILALPIQYRKLYLYMNLHDNGQGDRLNMDGMDTLLSCYPTLVHDRGGSRYIDWWPGRLFIKKACELYNRMADHGLMDGVKFVPTGIQYDKPIKQFCVRLQRGRHYSGLPAFQDESPYASLPDLRPTEEEKD
jgi:hypothetical protein